MARLATAGADGQPYLVPVTFAVDDDLIYITVDHKPKTTVKLKRLRNIRENPRVAILADHYDDDWDQLWWVRVDGTAEIHDRGEQMATGYDLLRRKYPQYQRVSLTGPVIAIAVSRWSSWQA